MRIIITPNFENIDLNHPDLLKTKDVLLVECAEIWDDRIGNEQLQAEYGFGLTQLGGLTVQLGNDIVSKIVKFNYKVEETNEVGLCTPYNLVITPRKFYSDVFLNEINQQTYKYISDIIDANEIHQKRSSIYMNFVYGGGQIQFSWENDEIKRKSLDIIQKYLLMQNTVYTKNIYIIS